MAENKPFGPCNQNKLELLGNAHKALNNLENLAFKDLMSISGCEDYQSVPCLTNNLSLTRIFGLMWMKYLLDGVPALEQISKYLLETVKVPIFREVIYQIKTDILIHSVQNQKLAKESVIIWTKEFPNSSNALR